MALSDRIYPEKQFISELGGPTTVNAKTRRMLGFTFTLDARYDIFDIVGSGAYGVVAAAVDKTTGKTVAIKKLENAFQHSTLAKRLLRELKIMRLMCHDNTLSIDSIQLPRSIRKLNEIYVITELMETDLSSLIKSGHMIKDEHCSFFLYQLLRGVKYMKSANVVHRDLKPRNILLNRDCELKICDFGLARVCNGVINSDVQMTDYVATRWYRAPEVLLKMKNYSFAMDMWSVGCIFAELLARAPLLPGSNSFNQLKMIFSLIGTPSQEDIALIPSTKYQDCVNSLPISGSKIEKKFREASPLAVDLLKKMLVFNPNKRIEVEKALEHPYLAHLHLPEDEAVAKPLYDYEFAFEKRQLNLKMLKEIIYDEILLYHSVQRKREYECDLSTCLEMNRSLNTSEYLE